VDKQNYTRIPLNSKLQNVMEWIKQQMELLGNL